MSETNQHTHHRNECSPDVGLHFCRRCRKHLEKNEIYRKVRFKRLHRYLREDCWHRKSSRSLKKRGTNRSERQTDRQTEKSFRIEVSFQHFTFGIRLFLEQIHLRYSPLLPPPVLFCYSLLGKWSNQKPDPETKTATPKNKKEFFYFFCFFFFRTSWTNKSLDYSLFSLSAPKATGLSPSYFAVRQKSVSSHTNKTSKKIDETRTFLRWTKSDTEEMQIHTHRREPH